MTDHVQDVPAPSVKTQWVAIAVSCAVSFVVNFILSLLILGMFQGAEKNWMFLVSQAFLGVLAAQALVVAVWMTLGSSPLVVRIPVSCGFVLSTVLAWFSAVSLMEWVPPVEVILFTGCLCIGLFFWTTLPLWIARRLSRARIGRRHDPQYSPAREQISIGYILLFTAAVAALLAIARFALSAADWSGRFSIGVGEAIGLAVFLLTLGAFIAAIGLAMVYGILSDLPTRRAWLIAAVIAVVAYIAIRTISGNR